MNNSSSSALSLRRLLWLACVFAFSAASAFAQLSSATLNGVVRDSTGAVIAKASVTLGNVDTGIERPGSSNESGNYVFADIVPGRYTLKIIGAGFLDQAGFRVRPSGESDCNHRRRAGSRSSNRSGDG